MRNSISRVFLFFLPVLAFIFSATIFAQSSPGIPTPVPPEMACATDCPGIGVDADVGSLSVSPSSNSCGGVTGTVVYQGIQIATGSKPRNCPSFIDYTPSCGRTVGRPGCCVIEMTDRPVLRQTMECKCTGRFLGFLWCTEWSCATAGSPVIIDILDSCATGAACSGGGAPSDCHKELP